MSNILCKTEKEMLVKAEAIIENLTTALESFYSYGYGFKIDAIKVGEDGCQPTIIPDISNITIRVEKISKWVSTSDTKVGVGTPVDRKSPQEFMEQMKAISDKLPADSEVYGSLKLFIKT
ncbi:MAG: hypothetical protein RRZ64_08075 [Rikenellaceae bacterium]